MHKNNPMDLVDDMMFTKLKYEIRKKSEQLEVAELRVSTLKKKLTILKKELKKIKQ